MDHNQTLNPFIRLALGFIRLYRLILSPWLGNQCRFHPTCSHYAEEAFLIHGFFKGFGLTLWRILRCAPWGRGSWIDPVPPKHISKNESHTGFAWARLLRYNEAHSTKLSEKLITPTEQDER
ncbi:MAG: membrane protein insertion efficiency factor YidD [Alphaproteobacteria bacterium]|nr:membrane protein insertion efficiency factor YidD [Alphaproteobacteria bacterium]MCB9985767.1 membrane protein insertion efficiency factor YidD [Micavibrio sp.]HPQ50733.1 membrane protein insertion efficiency factor YidD [Alphaproteobacteria bacterium]